MKDVKMSRSLAMRTGVWSTLLQLVRIGIQTLVFLVFARHLGINELGYYSFAYAFVQITQSFVRTGVLEIVVASQRDDREFISSAYVSSLIFGALASAIIILAGAVALFNGEHGRSGLYLLVFSVLPLVEALGVVPEALLRRKLQFQSLTLRTLLALSVAAVVSLIAGSLGLGATALVAFNMTASVISTVVALIVCGRLPSLGATQREVREISKPALNVALSTLASGSIVPLSQIAVGTISGAAAAGAYAIAQRLVALINTVTVDPVRLTALPILSRLAGDEEGRRNALLEAAGLSMTLLAPLYLGVAAISGVVLPLMLGPNGALAAPVLQALTWHFIPLVMSMISAQLLLVLGRSRQVLTFTLAQSAAGLVFAFAAAPFGAAAVAWAYVVRAYLVTPLVLRQAWVYGGVRPSRYLAAMVPPVACAAGMALGVALIIKMLSAFGLAPLPVLFIAVPFGAAAYGGLMMLLGRNQVKSAVRALGALKSAPPKPKVA